MRLKLLKRDITLLYIQKIFFHTSITVAMCAVMSAYTPPEAPARKTVGSVILVARDPSC